MPKYKGDGVPDRWLEYTKIGSVIPGTRFIACKVPLKDNWLRKVKENEWFRPEDLMDAVPKIGLIVDLTNTNRYYTPAAFTKHGILYDKILCPGHVVPPASIVDKFQKIVSDFLEKSEDPESLIVVHCTHGVNRTGYLIASYMINKMNFQPEEAIQLIGQARGHGIERQNYVNDLKNGCQGGSESYLDPKVMNKIYGKLRHERNKSGEETNAGRGHGPLRGSQFGGNHPQGSWRRDLSEHFQGPKNYNRHPQIPQNHPSRHFNGPPHSNRNFPPPSELQGQPIFRRPNFPPESQGPPPDLPRDSRWPGPAHPDQKPDEDHRPRPPPQHESSFSDDARVKFSWTPHSYDNLPTPSARDYFDSPPTPYYGDWRPRTPQNSQQSHRMFSPRGNFPRPMTANRQPGGGYEPGTRRSSMWPGRK